MIIQQVILLIIINLSLQNDSINCENKDADGVCINTRSYNDVDFPFEYDNLFKNQRKISNSQNTNPKYFFNLEANDKIFGYLKQFKLLPMPKNRFAGKAQGNFLHFMHLAYTKGLPIYFTVDPVLYPFIEASDKILQIYLENAYIPLLEHFLKEIAIYSYNSDHNLNATKYFGVGLYFLEEKNFRENIEKLNMEKEEKIKYIDEIKNITKNILNVNYAENKEGENEMDNMYFYFSLFGKERFIHKLTFQAPNSFWGKNQKIKNLLYCIRWFQNFQFILNIEDLPNIYTIGKIIHDSKLSENFLHLKKAYKYFFNEEQATLNPYEIFIIILQKLKESNTTETTFNMEKYEAKSLNFTQISKMIKNYLILKPDLSFTNNYTFTSNESKEFYLRERYTKSSLFSYSFSLKDWVNSHMTSAPKMRLYPSLFEFIDIGLHGTFMRNFTFDRFNGINSTNNSRLLAYRDGIDMFTEFNSTKKLIDDSFKNEEGKWKNTFQNHFYYMLSNLENENDRVSKNNMLIKDFNTLIGSFVHFDKGNMIYQQKIKNEIIINEAESCNSSKIVDVFFEPKKIFYKELLGLIYNFSGVINSTFEFLNKNKIEVGINISKVNVDIYNFINPFIKACNLICKFIENQFGYPLIDNEKEELKNILHFNNVTKSYEGWYYDLFKPIEDKEKFDYNIFASNFYNGKPIEKIKFPGVLIYAVMHYLEIGLTLQKDIRTKTDKILLYCSYAGNEYPHKWEEKVNLEQLVKLLVYRK